VGQPSNSGTLQTSFDGEVLTFHTRVTSVSADHVWDVLADGRLLTEWAVGASPVREVDPDWPRAGSRLHHAVGRGRLAVRSETRVLAAKAGRVLKLQTAGWPSGRSELTITLEPMGTTTIIGIAEVFTGGPSHLVPAPANNLLSKWRASEALRRLAFLAELR
jgi:hypothetical protein